MQNYRAEPTRPDKAKAVGGVIAVYAVIVGAALMIPNDSPLRLGDGEPTVLIDIKQPPPAQPPPPDEFGKAEEEEGAAGKRAEPTPVVAPKPAIQLPTKPPVTAAPTAGTGSGTTAGASTSGSGPGAGGSGSGRGGGGTGGSGGDIGSDARLLGGNSAKLPSRLLRQFAADRGYGYLLLTVSEAGRVSDCSVLQTTGSSDVDQALCGIMVKQSRWSPALDKQGRPTAVKIRYTATWTKN